MNITVTINDKASSAIAELTKKVTSKQLNSAAGSAAQRTVQRHLGQLDAERANKLGGKRTHFFASAARGTTYKADKDGVVVSIQKLGIRLQYEGGTVKPVNSKYLTIPARAEAHGKRAGEFDNLELLWGRNGPYALAERASQSVNFKAKGDSESLSTTKGRKKGGGVFFWLCKSATLQPDPDIIPSEQSLSQAVKFGVYDYLNRKGA